MSNRSIFYGWWVVAAFSVMTFTSTGVRHAVGPFLKPIVDDLGLDRASFSAVIALSLFLYGVFMPLAGMALDRFSVRAVTSVGTVVLVISLVLTAMVRNFWEFAAVYGVLRAARARRHRARDRLGRGRALVQQAPRAPRSRVLGSASMTGMSLLVPGRDLAHPHQRAGAPRTSLIAAGGPRARHAPLSLGGPRLAGVGRADRRRRRR